MIDEKTFNLLIRGLKDIQAQAEKILSGDTSSVSIESFACYSIELKDYISKNVSHESINSYLTEIPDINYRRNETKLWEYLVLPIWWIALYKDYVVKNKIVDEIRTIRGQYSHLEMLIKRL